MIINFPGLPPCGKVSGDVEIIMDFEFFNTLLKRGIINCYNLFLQSFTYFSFQLFIKFRIVLDNKFYSISSLSQFSISIAEP